MMKRHYPAVFEGDPLSGAMVEDKARDVLSTGAPILLSGDGGCLLNIGRRLAAMGSRSAHATSRNSHAEEHGTERAGGGRIPDPQPAPAGETASNR